MTNILKNEVYSALLEIGLPLEAAELYLAISNGAENNLSHLANQLKISRPHLYKLIYSLENKGLIKFSPESKDNKLQLLSPSEILSQMREKKAKLINNEKQFVEILPGLIEKYKQNNLPTKVKIITGQQDLTKLFFQIVEEENEMSEFLGSAEDFIFFMSWEKEMQYINARIKKQLSMRVLLLPSPTARDFQIDDKKQLRETRFYMGKKQFQTGFQLYANKAIFWQPLAKIAILIEDEYLVAMMKSIFYFCWEKSKPNHRKNTKTASPNLPSINFLK